MNDKNSCGRMKVDLEVNKVMAIIELLRESMEEW